MTDRWERMPQSSRGEDFKVPHWPTECGVVDCVDEDEMRRSGKRKPRDTDVAVAIVTDPQGKRRSGPLSKFSSSPYSLSAGFSFVCWVTRCAECYMREQDARGTSQVCVDNKTAW